MYKVWDTYRLNDVGTLLENTLSKKFHGIYLASHSFGIHGKFKKFGFERISSTQKEGRDTWLVKL